MCVSVTELSLLHQVCRSHISQIHAMNGIKGRNQESNLSFYSSQNSATFQELVISGDRKTLSVEINSFKRFAQVSTTFAECSQLEVVIRGLAAFEQTLLHWSERHPHDCQKYIVTQQCVLKESESDLENQSLLFRC